MCPFFHIAVYMSLQFRHFIPKDDDLKFFIANDAIESPVESILKKLDDDFNDQVTQAKQRISNVTKAPMEPNWDLKQEYKRRNNRLEKQTARAMARLAGKVPEDVEDQLPQQQDDTMPRPDYVPTEEDSGDSDIGEDFRAAQNMMSGISKNDLGKSEDD